MFTHIFRNALSTIWKKGTSCAEKEEKIGPRPIFLYLLNESIWMKIRKNCLINQQMQTKKLNTNLQQKLLHKRRLLMFCCIYSFNIANQGELPLGRKHIILHL